MIGKRTSPRENVRRERSESPVDTIDYDIGAVPTAEQVGETLRQTREGRGLSLEEMAQRTRIRQIHLESLEAGQVEKLPGATFVAGFMRIYARTLEMADMDLVERFLADFSNREQALRIEPPPPPSSANRPKSGMVIGGVVLLGLALFVYERYFSAPSPEMPIPTPSATTPLRVGEEMMQSDAFADAGGNEELEGEERSDDAEDGTTLVADAGALLSEPRDVVPAVRISNDAGESTAGRPNEPQPILAVPVTPEPEPPPPVTPEPEPPPPVTPEPESLPPLAVQPEPPPPMNTEPAPLEPVRDQPADDGTAPAIDRAEIETESIPESVNGGPGSEPKAGSGGFFAMIKQLFSGSGEASKVSPPPPASSPEPELPAEPVVLSETVLPSDAVESPEAEKPAAPAVVVSPPPPPVEERSSAASRSPEPVRKPPPVPAVPPVREIRPTRQPAMEPQRLPAPERPEVPEMVIIDEDDQPASVNTNDPRDVIRNRYPEKIRGGRDLEPESPRAISLVSEELVWVQIQDEDGEVLKDMVMQPNHIFRVPKGMTFFAALGNAGAIRVRIGSDKLSYVGQPGEAVQDLELTPGALRKRAGR